MTEHREMDEQITFLLNEATETFRLIAEDKARRHRQIRLRIRRGGFLICTNDPDACRLEGFDGSSQFWNSYAVATVKLSGFSSHKATTTRASGKSVPSPRKTASAVISHRVGN